MSLKLEIIILNTLFIYVYSNSYIFISITIQKSILFSRGKNYFSQFSRSVVSHSLRPHGPSTPGLPVDHQLPESTQTHVHWVGDAIKPSHPQSSPSPALDLSHHQGLFQWVNSTWGGQSIGVSASASVFPVNSQDWSPLGWTGWIPKIKWQINMKY